MSSRNVLITGAGTANAVVVARALRRAFGSRVRLMMADTDPKRAGCFLGDEYVWLPPALDASFSQVAEDLCGRHRIDLVIPTIDDEFEAWSILRATLLDQGTRVVISGPEAIATCRWKDRTIQFLRDLRIPCPMTWRSSEVADPAQLPYPVFVKPRCGRGSRQAQVVRNQDEYAAAVRGLDMIVQPHLEGKELTIDTLCDFDGKFLGAVARERVEIKAGQAYRSVTIHAPELLGHAETIASELKLVGPANMQCMLTDSGPQFFEVNPRFGAGTALSIEAGLDGPAILMELLDGHRPPRPRPRANVWMLRHWEEVFWERDRAPIFFDLDGPLLDVRERHYQVYSDILREAHETPLPCERYWDAKRARMPHDEILAASAHLETGRNFMSHWMERIEAEQYLRLDRVWPWVMEILSQLHRHHPLYLVTVRSFPERLRRQLDQLHLSPWFEKVLCRPAAADAGATKAAMIQEEFAEIPQGAIIVGDTEADIACGKQLGFGTVGVLCGIRNREQLELAGCDRLISDVRELPDCISTLFSSVP